MTINFNDGSMDALARSAGVTNIVRQVTEQIAGVVRSTAPVDSSDYKNGIKARVKYQRRPVGVVEATDPKSLIVESKTGVMARAVKRSARRR